MKLIAYPIWDTVTDLEVPAMIAHIPAGEPMDLIDEVEMVDLNYLLTKDCPDALFLKVQGDSMCNDVSDGDWILVSRSVQPEIGNIVVASVNGEHTLKRLKQSDLGRKLYLVPSNINLTPREMMPSDDFKVLATVMKVIRSVR